MEDDDPFEWTCDILGGGDGFKATQVPVMDWVESLIAKGSFSAVADDCPAVKSEQEKAVLLLASSRLIERHHAK